MSKRNFRAVVVTRGALITAAAALFAFMIVFLGAKSVMSGIRLAIGQRYVIRAVSSASGAFSQGARWEFKDDVDYCISLLKFILGVDISSPQSTIANVSVSLSAMTPAEVQKDLPVMAKSQPSPSASAPPQAPSPSAAVENARTSPPSQPPAIVERVSQAGSGNMKGPDGVNINNETDFKVDINAIMSQPPPFKLGGKGPQVLIVHTHTTESYTPSARFQFSHTDTDRTTDLRYSVARVGDELADCLGKYKIGVVHSKAVHDYPEYLFCYNRAYNTIMAEMAKNPSIKIVLDIHRDSIVDKNGSKIKISDVINNEKVAQVMTVVGTNGMGLKHDNWRVNLQFALMLQQEFVKIHPSFARPVNLRTARFNGHTAPGAVIIEVGSGANTLDEALASCKFIAKAVNSVIQRLK